MKIRISIICALILLSVPVLAGAPATPIDGGLSILLLIGGALGIKKLVDTKNK